MKIFNINNEDNQKSLLIYISILAFIIFIGICFSFFIFLYLDKKNTQISSKIEYQNTKIHIARYIVSELYQLESNFFRITTADNKKVREFLKENINNNFENIKKVLAILKDGGELKETIKLNLVNKTQNTVSISLKYPIDKSYYLEAIEILPQLETLRESVNEITKIYEECEKLDKNSNEAITKLNEIKKFLKTEPAIISRMIENTNRLLFESISQLKLLKNELEQERLRYINMMHLSVGALILFSGILFIIIAKKILELNQKLEKRIKQEVEKNRKADHIIFEQQRRASIQELLINIAHQWRQPLNVVTLSVQQINEMIQENEIDKELLDQLSTNAITQIQKISSVISAFTTFYEKQNQISEFSIKDSIENAISFFGDQFINKKITINNNTKDEHLIIGHKTEMVEVFLALFQNVIDAKERANKESATINIDSKLEKESLEILICDDCGGIDKKILPIVFDPYTTTSFKTHNKGLGLYFVKNIIEYKFKGTIIARNSDIGACFEIILPIGK